MRQMIPVLFSALALVLAAALPAQAQERVQSRGWAKSSHGRIIFDWPRPVEHQAKLGGGKLTVSFERSMQTDLRGVVSGLAGYVTGARLSPDGKMATFDLAGNFDMETFVTGSSVVVDLRRPGGAAAVSPTAISPASTAISPSSSMNSTPVVTGSAADRVQVDVSDRPGYTRIVLDVKDKSGAQMAVAESTSEDVNKVPGMVGSEVALSGIPLVTEEDPAQAANYQGTYSPLTHYDPNATGMPRNLLLYDRPSLRKSMNGG